MRSLSGEHGYSMCDVVAILDPAIRLEIDTHPVKNTSRARNVKAARTLMPGRGLRPEGAITGHLRNGNPSMEQAL